MVSTDTTNNLLGAMGLSELGATPQRWFVDWSYFEPGALLPHPHIYVVNPYETSAHGPMNVWCIACFAQFGIRIITQDRCTGLSLHIYTDIGPGGAAHITAKSNLQERKTKESQSTNLEAPHFHDALALLIRDLADVVISPDECASTSPGSINVESKVFRNQIGFDEARKTPKDAQIVNRCGFQLEMVLMEAKRYHPGMFQGLVNHFGGHKVENAYERIFGKLDVTELTESPPVLQIQLMRTHFNRSHMASYKSDVRFSLPRRCTWINIWNLVMRRVPTGASGSDSGRRKEPDADIPSTRSSLKASVSALQPEVQPATQSATQSEAQSEAQPETQEYTLKEIPPEVDVLEIETIAFSAPENPVTNGHVEGDEAAEEGQSLSSQGIVFGPWKDCCP
ncbi:MAG: hypothetical protein J3Q66DRAFT_368604 [Benniella sp.]|nr:MAG: hypothetical protein J3Q66DRAFT_368604 [Benniella sp.]